VVFNYDDGCNWYKGDPKKYKSNVSTKELNAEKIIFYRDLLEKRYKKWKKS
jgi:hypothetical protein